MEVNSYLLVYFWIICNSIFDERIYKQRRDAEAEGAYVLNEFVEPHYSPQLPISELTFSEK